MVVSKKKQKEFDFVWHYVHRKGVNCKHHILGKRFVHSCKHMHLGCSMSFWFTSTGNQNDQLKSIFVVAAEVWCNKQLWFWNYYYVVNHTLKISIHNVSCWFEFSFMENEKWKSSEFVSVTHTHMWMWCSKRAWPAQIRYFNPLHSVLSILNTSKWCRVPSFGALV